MAGVASNFFFYHIDRNVLLIVRFALPVLGGACALRLQRVAHHDVRDCVYLWHAGKVRRLVRFGRRFFPRAGSLPAGGKRQQQRLCRPAAARRPPPAACPPARLPTCSPLLLPPSSSFCCWSDANIVGMARANQRRCRDALCCSLFLLFWVGMIVIGGFAYYYGNPLRLVYGTDYQGTTCGTGAQAAAPFITYPRLQTDFILNLAAADPLAYRFYGVCVPTCPGTRSVVCNYGVGAGASQAALLSCLEGGGPPPAPLSLCANVTAGCWVTPIATSSTFFRCIPVYNTTNSAASTCVYPANVSSAADPACVLATTVKLGVTTAPAQTNQLFSTMATARQTVGRWFGDLVRAWWALLLCAVGVPLVLAFVWLLFAKCFTWAFVWGTVLLLTGVLVALTIFLYDKAGLISITLPQSIQAEVNVFQTSVSGVITTVSYFVPQTFSLTPSATSYKVLAGIFTAITLIVVFIIIALRIAIATAIKAIQLGAEALQDVPSLLMCVARARAAAAAAAAPAARLPVSPPPPPSLFFSQLPRHDSRRHCALPHVVGVCRGLARHLWHVRAGGGRGGRLGGAGRAGQPAGRQQRDGGLLPLGALC